MGKAISASASAAASTGIVLKTSTLSPLMFSSALQGDRLFFPGGIWQRMRDDASRVSCGECAPLGLPRSEFNSITPGVVRLLYV